MAGGEPRATPPMRRRLSQMSPNHACASCTTSARQEAACLAAADASFIALSATMSRCGDADADCEADMRRCFCGGLLRQSATAAAEAARAMPPPAAEQ